MIRASGEPPVKGEWGGAGAGAGGRTWSRSGRTIIIAAISVQEGSREQESMQPLVVITGILKCKVRKVDAQLHVVDLFMNDEADEAKVQEQLAFCAEQLQSVHAFIDHLLNLPDRQQSPLWSFSPGDFKELKSDAEATDLRIREMARERRISLPEADGGSNQGIDRLIAELAEQADRLVSVGIHLGSVPHKDMGSTAEHFPSLIAAHGRADGGMPQYSARLPEADSDSNEGIDHLPDDDTDTVSFKRLLKETKGQSACGGCFLCQKKHTWIDLTSSEPGRNIISCEVCDVSELDWRQEVGRCPCANSVARNAVRIFSNGEWLPAQVIKVNEHSVVVEWRTANAVHYRRLKRPEETSDARKINPRIHHAIALRELGLPCNCQGVDVWSGVRGCWIADAVVLEPMPGSGKITVQFQDNGKTYYKDLQPDSKALRFPSSLMEQWKRDAKETWNGMHGTMENGMQRRSGTGSQELRKAQKQRNREAEEMQRRNGTGCMEQWKREQREKWHRMRKEQMALGLDAWIARGRRGPVALEDMYMEELK